MTEVIDLIEEHKQAVHARREADDRILVLMAKINAISGQHLPARYSYRWRAMIYGEDEEYEEGYVGDK